MQCTRRSENKMPDQNELFVAYLKQAQDMAKKLEDAINWKVEFKEFKEGLYLFEIKWGGPRMMGHGSMFSSKWWREIRRHGFRMVHLDIDYVERRTTFRIGYSPYKLVVIDE